MAFAYGSQIWQTAVLLLFHLAGRGAGGSADSVDIGMSTLHLIRKYRGPKGINVPFEVRGQRSDSQGGELVRGKLSKSVIIFSHFFDSFHVKNGKIDAK